MTIKNFLSANKKFFDIKDLEIFLEKILNCDKNFLFLNENFLISKKNFLQLEKFLEEKKAWYSVAAIIWEKYFYWKRFIIDKNVLVPREETEDLISYVEGKIWDNISLGGVKNILDIWTWSWIIPITLKLELEKLDEKNSLNYFASDISEKALDVAKKNSENFWVKIDFFKSDLLKNVPKVLNEEWVFLITANLPYVEDGFKADSVARKLWILKEPDLALYSWEDWLNHYRELLNELKNFKFKYLIMEMWICQTDIVAKMYSFFWKTEIYYDLGWNKRWVFVENINF